MAILILFYSTNNTDPFVMLWAQIIDSAIVVVVKAISAAAQGTRCKPAPQAATPSTGGANAWRLHSMRGGSIALERLRRPGQRCESADTAPRRRMRCR